MADENQITFESVMAELADLRDDQKEIMSVLGDLIREIKECPERLALAVVWLGEKDLLEDRPINWITNLKRSNFRTLIRHTYGRLFPAGVPDADEPDV